jgi:hypothetical protein
MLKSVILLLSLVPVFNTFTNFSSNPHSVYHYVYNKNSPSASKAIFVQQALPVKEKEEFKFQYTGCERLSSDSMRCNFTVINKRQRRPLTMIRETTRIIDGAGNEFRPLQVNIGVEKDTRSAYVSKLGKVISFATNEISTNAPINGSAIFNGPIQNPIRLFDIHFDDFHIEFNKEVNAKPLSS